MIKIILTSQDIEIFDQIFLVTQEELKESIELFRKDFTNLKVKAIFGNINNEENEIIRKFVSNFKLNISMLTEQFYYNFNIINFLKNTSPINTTIPWPVSLKSYLEFYFKVFFPSTKNPSYPLFLDLRFSNAQTNNIPKKEHLFLLSSFGLDSNYSLLDIINENIYEILIVGFVKNLNKCEYARELNNYNNLKKHFLNNPKYKNIVFKEVNYRGDSMQLLASQDNLTLILKNGKLIKPNEPIAKLHASLLLFKDIFLEFKVSTIIVANGGCPNYLREKHFSDLSEPFSYFVKFLSDYVGIQLQIIISGEYVSRFDKITKIYNHDVFKLYTRSCTMRNELFKYFQSQNGINIALFPHICGQCHKCEEDIYLLMRNFVNIFTSNELHRAWLIKSMSSA